MEKNITCIKNQASLKLLIHTSWVNTIVLFMAFIVYIVYKLDQAFLHYVLFFSLLSLISFGLYIYLINVNYYRKRVVVALCLCMFTFLADVLSTGIASQWNLELFLLIEINPVMRLISEKYPLISLINLLLLKLYIHLIIFFHYIALPQLQYLYSLAVNNEQMSKFEYLFYEASIQHRIKEPVALTKAYFKKKLVLFSPSMISCLLKEGLVDTVIITIIFTCVSINNLMIGMYIAGDQGFNFVTTRLYFFSVFGFLGLLLLFSIIYGYPVSMAIIARRIKKASLNKC